MTPKEKALKLYDIYEDEMIEKEAYFVESAAKQCALIAVDEILKITSLINDGCGEETTLDYWEQVKTEIEQL